jgi:hypothetical protein
MKVPPSNNLPAWQIERERRLHRILTCIEGRMKRGHTLNRATRWFAWYYRNRFYSCDPARKVHFSQKTLVGSFYRWKYGGRIPAAVRLHYRPANRRIAAPVLIRFLNFSADRDWPSFRAAHEAFCKRGGNYGPGRVNGRRLELTYHSLKWNLPRRCFSEIQRQRKIIRQAEAEIQSLRQRFTAAINARVPAKLPRRQNSNFQI